MSAVPAPADRRFRRAHVKPARRRRNWRTLVRPVIPYGLIAVAAVYAVYGGGNVVWYAPMLQVDHIVVDGNERLSKGEVLAVLNGLRGESLLWTDLDAWKRRLLSSPWVRDAALRRSLPSTVVVRVLERRPIGIGRINGALYLVDDQGVIIDDYGPQFADLDLPIIDGLSPSSVDGGPMTDASRAELAARVIAALGRTPRIARRLSQIDVSDLHNVAVILSGDPAVIHLGEEQFQPRLQSYLELAPALRDRVAAIDHVDVRFAGRIYVRPAEEPGRAGEAVSTKRR